MFSENTMRLYQKKYPILKDIMDLKSVYWENPNKNTSEKFSIDVKDMVHAEEKWKRFAPYFIKEFKEMNHTNGIIESPLKPIPHLQHALEEMYSSKIAGDMYLKCDNELPIAGSVKARGGIYEVLYIAEKIALEAELIQLNESYELFSSEKLKNHFRQYTIGVGSTGNLGLSIGMMSARLGFQVSVYMSRDAKEWKKNLLRQNGVNVMEMDGDFSEAVSIARKEISAKSNGYFVDDENSKQLFLGYSTAAFRLKEQLEEKGIKVDKEHPLLVYIPCGVGGAPGGVTFGLKQIFKDSVHCFLVEPVHSPSMLTGLVTGEMGNISVQDFGIDNRTEADGLAVGRPSKFASDFINQLVSGIYTIEDETLFRLLSLLADNENIYVEPSATAGLMGPLEVGASSYLERQGMNAKQATHIVWATGGSLVPQKEMENFYQIGKELLNK